MMFGFIGKLNSLLSDDNVRYLDVLLAALTDPKGSPVYDVLWSWFTEKFPHLPDARVQAWKALRQLHLVVREYRERKGM